MIEQTLRHEYKHLINQLELETLRRRLSAVMKRDTHSGIDGTYIVRSLYFDNYNDKVLQEKLDGISRREKFRLRYYNQETDRVRLEKKFKINNRSGKISALLSRTEAEQLLAGSTSWLLERPEPVLHELYAKMTSELLRPKAQVVYQREAFSFPAGNVRITLDSQIRTGLFSTDYFCGDLSMLTAEMQGQAIMEVKFDAFLPGFITDIIQIGSRQSSALSKYAICRITG